MLDFNIYMDDDAIYRVLLSTGLWVVGRFTSEFAGRDGFITMLRAKDGYWVDLNPAHVVAIQVEQ